jgi:adenylosuccinate lyase
MSALDPLLAISPIDGRYRVAELADFFSEFALIKNRLKVEVEWIKAMANSKEIEEVGLFQCCCCFVFSNEIFF